MRAVFAYGLVVAIAVASAQAVPPPIVGLSFVGRGVDVTTMTFGLGQITENTYQMNQTWTNPQNNVTYVYPDDMFAQTLSYSGLSNATTTFSGIMDYQEWAKHTYHWHSGFLGLVSHTKTTYAYVDRMYNSDESLAQTDVKVEFLQLSAPIFPPLTLSPVFELSVEKLPSTCCDNPADYAKYSEFFQSFGTAFMDSANLGGHLLARTWYAKCLLNVTTQSWISQQSSWSVLDIIGGGHGSSSNSYQINGAFKTCNTQEFEYYGGVATGLQPNQYASWIESTFETPFPVTFTLQPIYALVPDATKAALIQTAMTVYLQQAQAALNEREAAAAAKDPHLVQQCCKVIGDNPPK